MKKFFLFLFAAVLSIGAAMAQTTHDFYCEGVSVSTNDWSIQLSGSWDGTAFVLSLWQDNTQGYGTYEANAQTGYSMNLGVKELKPTTTGTYTDMGDGTFVFQGTMTDDTDTYEVYLKGSTGSGEGSGEGESLELEGETNVSFYCDADGFWTIEASDDTYSVWGLYLNAELTDASTGECTLYGTYTDYSTYDEKEVSGTGMISLNDYTGHCELTNAALTTEDGLNIYPVLSASYLELTFETLMTGDSWYSAGNYYNVYMYVETALLTLDVHIENYTGDGDYEVSVVDEETEEYSSFSTNDGVYMAKVTGNMYVEGDAYGGELTTLDASGNTAMTISYYAKAPAAYNINVNNATVVNNIDQWGSSWSMTGEAEIDEVINPVELTISGDVDLSVPNAELAVGLTVGDLGFAEGPATVTISGNTMTVAGTIESTWLGVTYIVNISGTLPTCPSIRLQSGDNESLLNMVNGEAVNVTVARNLTANDGYYTLCVPFNMPASVIGKAYQIAEVLGNSATGIEVNFTEVSTIVAGQPYLILPSSNMNGFTVENATINNSAPAAVTTTGAGVSITMQGMFSRNGQTNGLYWIGNGGYLYNDNKYTNAMCAYFSITTPSGMPPRVRVVTEENSTTDIENIQTSVQVLKTIENGQLVITRDGVKYNIQGQKL